MITLIEHKIGEQFVLLSDLPAPSLYRVYRAIDGKYFNSFTSSFEFMPVPNSVNYDFPLYPHPTIPYLSLSRINYLPRIPLDLVFEFLSASNKAVPLSLERHTFGGFFDEKKPHLCILYGTIFDPSGNPLKNTAVETYLNRSGYFVDKFPIIGKTASALTDDRGYFQLPIMQGLNVTVTIPATGFTTTGYVPKYSSLELTGYCLVREEQ